MASNKSKAYVQSIVDGSTFLTRQGVKIRLARVQAPEPGMPMAALARSKLRTLIHKQWVDMVSVGRRGNTIVCEVWLGDTSVNDRMRALL